MIHIHLQKEIKRLKDDNLILLTENQQLLSKINQKSIENEKLILKQQKEYEIEIQNLKQEIYHLENQLEIETNKHREDLIAVKKNYNQKLNMHLIEIINLKKQLKNSDNDKEILSLKSKVDSLDCELKKANDLILKYKIQPDMEVKLIHKLSIDEDKLIEKKSEKNDYEFYLPNEKTSNYFSRKALEWESYSDRLVDSHCHFDLLFNRIKFNKSTIDDYFEDFKSFYFKNFEACINVLCDPYKYSTKFRLNSYLANYKHEKIYTTIGCHPHFADNWSQQAEYLLYSSLSNSRVVAIGECGLDLSKKNNVNMSQQILVFKSQLKMAKETNMPIVIHCRDTEEKVFDLMSEHLNKQHRIHLHCFTGSWQIAKKYLEHFPNLCIGVTPLITFQANSNNDLKELVMNIPLDRLLLETDSPYFVPRLKNFPNYAIEYSHPGFVFATAECIAELRDVSISLIVNLTRKNVKKIYSF